jgi:spore germination cell wall hydrolase CwlJ-like protein
MLDPTEAARIADTFLLALCIWREARGESLLGKTAVACSIMERVKNPTWWGNDVQSVVTKKWQYSSMTDPHDPQLTLFPARTDSSWFQCLQVADEAVSNTLQNPVPRADSYYDVSIPPPRWATPGCFIGQVGRLRFYHLGNDAAITSVQGVSNA